MESQCGWMPKTKKTGSHRKSRARSCPRAVSQPPVTANESIELGSHVGGRRAPGRPPSSRRPCLFSTARTYLRRSSMPCTTTTTSVVESLVREYNVRVYTRCRRGRVHTTSVEYIMFVHHTRVLSIMYESIIHPVYIYIYYIIMHNNSY